MKIKSIEIPVRDLARVKDFFKVVLPEFAVLSVGKTLFAAMPEDLEISFVASPTVIQGAGPILEFDVADAESAFNSALRVGALCVSLPWFHEKGMLSANFAIDPGVTVQLASRVYSKKHVDRLRQQRKRKAIGSSNP